MPIHVAQAGREVPGQVFIKTIAVAMTALLAVLTLELVFGVRIGLVGWLHEQLTFSVQLVS